MKLRRFLSLLTFLSLLVMTGCEQTKSVISINPDGSGKIVYTATFPLDVQFSSNLQISDNNDPKRNKPAKPTDEQKAAEARKSVLSGTTGVETWSDVSCTATSDGLILFKGTAYFRDLAKVAISPLSGGSNGKVGAVRMEYQKTDKGYRITLFRNEKGHGKTGDNTPDDQSRGSPQQSVQRARTTWKYMRPMLETFIGNTIQTCTIVSPTPPKSVTGFTQTKDGYSFTFDGGKLIKAMDDIFAKSDAELSALFGKVVLTDSAALQEYVTKTIGFDPEHPPFVEVETAAPLFDYAREVAAAKPSYTALCAKMGGEAPETAEGAPAATAAVDGTGAVQRVSVSRISRSFSTSDDDHDAGGTASSSVELSIAFSGAVAAVTKAAVTEIVGTDGRAVDGRKTSCMHSLAQNKTSGKISCSLPADVSSLSGIKRMAGTLCYSVGSGSKTVDLGTLATQKGAKGTALEAEIEQAENGWLGIKFKADEAMVKAVRVFTPDGQPYPVSDFTLNGWQGYCTKTLRPAKGDRWPEAVQVKVEMFADCKATTVPWSVQDITFPCAGK